MLLCVLLGMAAIKYLGPVHALADAVSLADCPHHGGPATGGYVAVTDDGPSRSALPVPRLSPVSAVRLVPGQTTDWYLLATVRVTRPGQFRVKGLAVTYRVAGHTGRQTYPNELRIEAH